MKLSKKLNKLPVKVRPLVFAALIGVTGLAFVLATRAATPTASFEPEQGNKTANATTVSDSTASGAGAVKFAAAAPPTGSCSGAQHTAGGPDGNGGCWPGPDNTGVPGNITLTNYTGSMTISTDGTIIDSKRITGRLTINAKNVVIRNSSITVNDYYGLINNGTNLTIEDSTFVGGGTAAIVIASGDFTGRRLNVSGSEDGIRLANNSKLYDSYIHDLVGDASSHFDTVTADGFRGWEIVHNTIFNNNSQTAVVWIGDPRYGASEGLLQNNLMGGGGYCLYAGPGIGQGLRVINNIFTKKFYSRCGSFGLVAYWESANNTWTNNKYDDGTTASP